MKLDPKQILKIYKKVTVANGRTIVLIDVSRDKNLSPDKSNFNIYCIDKDFNLIWQVLEKGTSPIDDADMFVYLAQNDKGEIIADRFSGFVYKIDPETGEAEQIGFHK